MCYNIWEHKKQRKTLCVFVGEEGCFRDKLFRSNFIEESSVQFSCHAISHNNDSITCEWWTFNVSHYGVIKNTLLKKVNKEFKSI
jgi:hypothetical protein